METFTVSGVNYKKATVQLRSKFSLSSETVKDIYLQFKKDGIRNILILSTCNRTEIYSYNNSEQTIRGIFRRYKSLEDHEIEEHLMHQSGQEAVYHLFKVSAGLESQIIGDYEIAGQLRTAIRIADEAAMLDGIFRKILETSLQSGKAVRSATCISDGTTSTSYSVIHHIRETGIADLRIGLIGWGKIGLSTYRNLRQHLPAVPLTLLNRSAEKLDSVANETSVSIESLQNLGPVLRSINVIIVATGADKYILNAALLEQSAVRYIFDLSVPSNLDPDVQKLKTVRIFNIDDLSKEIDQNLEKRIREIPHALSIIKAHIQQLRSWQQRKLSRSIFS